MQRERFELFGYRAGFFLAQDGWSVGSMPSPPVGSNVLALLKYAEFCRSVANEIDRLQVGEED